MRQKHSHLPLPLPSGSPLAQSMTHGSALVITLSLIVLLTILVVGFVTTARLERTASNSHLAGQEATLFAKMGVDVAAARVQTATSGSSGAWISTPGRIITSSTSLPATAPKTVDLFSGEIDSVESDISVNLNPTSLTQAKGLIMADAAVPLPQRWIYVKRDGTQQVATIVPTYDKANPVVGRYAFWTNDESTRINWNTAWTRDVANPHNAAHPSRIDLTAASPVSVTEATEIDQFRTNKGLFSSPVEIKAVANAVEARTIADAESFSFTHYNHSPALNVFGEKRRVLTTRKDRAGANDFFDIVTIPNNDPGLVSSLDNLKVADVFKQLYSYFTRTDWPLLPGKSFVGKYGADNAAQIALNIIDYVRSAESSLAVVQPLRGTFDAASGTFAVNAGVATPNVLLGNTRRPLLTEMGIYVPLTTSLSGTTTVYQCKAFVEVYLPKEAGASINLASGYTMFVATAVSGSVPESDIVASEVKGSAIMVPGDYRTIVRTIAIPAATPPTPPTAFSLRVAISNKTPGAIRLDVAPSANQAGNFIEYTATPGTPEGSIQSVAVDDPYVNRNKGDWKLGSNTFGSPPVAPTSTLGTLSNVNPQQDTDADGLIVSTSVDSSVPAPNTVIQSAGEIGLIHSGIRGNPAGKGTPWRTLRLQPKNDGKDSLPDWLLVDLFTAPLTTSGNAAINPQPDANGNPTAKGGLINLNGALYPFKNADGTALLDTRTLPLQALLQGANKGAVTSSLAKTLAANILAQTSTTNGTIYGEKGTYTMPGEISEILGIASGGEASEAVVRDVIELCATRGNVYGVYSVGQSIRQSPTGTIHPIAEKRTLTIFERSTSGIKVVYEQALGL